MGGLRNSSADNGHKSISNGRLNLRGKGGPPGPINVLVSIHFRDICSVLTH